MGNPTIAGSVSGVGDADLLAALAQTERARRVLYGQQVEILAELVGRPLPQGYPSVAAVLREVLRLNPVEARRRVEHANTLIATHTPSGAVIDPELPGLCCCVAGWGDR